MLFGQEARVNWAFQKEQKEEVATHFHVFVGDLSSGEEAVAAAMCCCSVVLVSRGAGWGRGAHARAHAWRKARRGGWGETCWRVAAVGGVATS